MAKKVSIVKEKIFGRSAYVIKVGSEKKFFEFSKAKALKKAAKLR